MSDHHDQLERATRDRLAKLGSMPVDLSRLEQRLADQLPQRQQAIATQARPMRAWLRLAAIIALFAGVAAGSYLALFSVGPPSAVAQSMTVAQLHKHLLTDRQQDYLAQSVGDAQPLIDAQLAGQQPLPIIDGTRVESCCLVEGHFPLRAALVIEHHTGPVTIIIAQGDDFAHPMHRIDHPSGIELQGHEHAGLPMVMRNQGGLWMCVMGEIDQSELADIAAAIRMP